MPFPRETPYVVSSGAGALGASGAVDREDVRGGGTSVGAAEMVRFVAAEDLVADLLRRTVHVSYHDLGAPSPPTTVRTLRMARAPRSVDSIKHRKLGGGCYGTPVIPRRRRPVPDQLWHGGVLFPDRWYRNALQLDYVPLLGHATNCSKSSGTPGRRAAHRVHKDRTRGVHQRHTPAPSERNGHHCTVLPPLRCVARLDTWIGPAASGDDLPGRSRLGGIWGE